MIRIKLDEYLKSVNITKCELSKRAKIKFQTLDNYCKNNITRYDRNILAQICTCLKCDITDIIEFISDNQDD